MKMDYVVLGTNDMAKAVTFYDAIFDTMGIAQIGASDRMTYWGGEEFAFALALPFDGESASAGNGTMIGFGAGSQDEVDRLHQMVLDLGGTDEGAPGPRGPRYTGYARDLDGNKICFYA